jgi:hypothetical protein
MLEGGLVAHHTTRLSLLAKAATDGCYPKFETVGYCIHAGIIAGIHIIQMRIRSAGLYSSGILVFAETANLLRFFVFQNHNVLNKSEYQRPNSDRVRFY